MARVLSVFPFFITNDARSALKRPKLRVAVAVPLKVPSATIYCLPKCLFTSRSPPPLAVVFFPLHYHVERQGFGHAVFCARHALLGTGDSAADPATVRENGRPSSLEASATTVGDGTKGAEEGNAGGKGPESGGGGAGSGGRGGSDVESEEEEDSSFMLVLGDHLYRRGAGTTHACASQLIHAFLEHGEAGKPAIGLKVRRRRN